MDLNDAQGAWRELDRRMEAGAALELRLLREVKLQQARGTLRLVAIGPIVELLINVPAALWVGSFLADHLREPKFAAPAVALLIVEVLLIALDVRQLALIQRIDYSAPVVAIQRRLTELRRLRIRITQWAFLLAPLLWTPLLIVGAQGLGNFDVYRAFGPLWIAVNLALGMAVIPLTIWITRRNAERLRTSRLLALLADDIAGRSLVAANAQLDEIAQFENE